MRLFHLNDQIIELLKVLEIDLRDEKKLISARNPLYQNSPQLLYMPLLYSCELKIPLLFEQIGPLIQEMIEKIAEVDTKGHLWSILAKNWRISIVFNEISDDGLRNNEIHYTCSSKGIMIKNKVVEKNRSLRKKLEYIGLLAAYLTQVRQEKNEVETTPTVPVEVPVAEAVDKVLGTEDIIDEQGEQPEGAAQLPEIVVRYQGQRRVDLTERMKNDRDYKRNIGSEKRRLRARIKEQNELVKKFLAGDLKDISQVELFVREWVQSDRSYIYRQLEESELREKIDGKGGFDKNEVFVRVKEPYVQLLGCYKVDGDELVEIRQMRRSESAEMAYDYFSLSHPDALSPLRDDVQSDLVIDEKVSGPTLGHKFGMIAGDTVIEHNAAQQWPATWKITQKVRGDAWQMADCDGNLSLLKVSASGFADAWAEARMKELVEEAEDLRKQIADLDEGGVELFAVQSAAELNSDINYLELLGHQQNDDARLATEACLADKKYQLESLVDDQKKLEMDRLARLAQLNLKLAELEQMIADLPRHLAKERKKTNVKMAWKAINQMTEMEKHEVTIEKIVEGVRYGMLFVLNAYFTDTTGTTFNQGEFMPLENLEDRES